MPADNVVRLPGADAAPPVDTRITWAADLRERSGPPDDIVAGAIPKRVATLFAGPAGYGKTYLCQLLQTAAATERKWLGMEVRHSRSLGIYSEDPPDQLAKRQRKISAHYGIDSENLVEWMAMLPNDDGDFILFSCGYYKYREGHPRPLWGEIERRIAEDGIELLILDNAQNVFQGDALSPPHVNSFLRWLNGIARRLDIAIILTCNPAKDGMSPVYGTQKWLDSARHGLTLGKVDKEDDEDGRFRLQVLEKSNYLPWNHPLKRRGVELEWNDGVLVRVDDGEPAPLDPLQRLDVKLKMVSAAEFAVTKLGHVFNASPLSKTYLPSVLAKQAAWRHISWRDLTGIYEDLMANGRLVKVAIRGQWFIRAPNSSYLGET